MGRGLPDASLPHPDGLPAQKGIFLEMNEAECQYLNGTKRVRFVERYIYNREEYAHFDSDLGLYVANTPLGELQAQYWNSQPDTLEYERGEVDTFCRKSYKVLTPFITERKGERVAVRCPWPGTSRAPGLAAGRVCPSRAGAGPRAAPSKAPAPFPEGASPSAPPWARPAWGAQGQRWARLGAGVRGGPGALSPAAAQRPPALSQLSPR